MNNPVWIDDKGKIIEPEYCRDFLSRHPMCCINDRFYTVDGPLPDESKLKRTIYEEISPWLHAKVAQTVEQVIKALKLAAYADPLPLQCDRRWQRFARGYVINIASAMPEIITHLIFRDTLF